MAKKQFETDKKDWLEITMSEAIDFLEENGTTEEKMKLLTSSKYLFKRKSLRSGWTLQKMVKNQKISIGEMQKQDL